MAKWQPLTNASSVVRKDAVGHTFITPVPPGFSWGNDQYSVMRREIEAPAPFGKGWWLSIHRRDKGPIRDWRHMQRIKTELCGPEREGVELYPAESRGGATSNEYAMFVFPKYRFPFGWEKGLKMNQEDLPVAGAKQRPLDEM